MRIFGRRKPEIKLTVAENFMVRLKGLLGSNSIPKNYAMFFPCTASVHTFFMGCKIDILMVDAEFKIVLLSKETPPFKIIRSEKALHTIEMASGEIKRLKIKEGDRVYIKWPPKKQKAGWF